MKFLMLSLLSLFSLSALAQGDFSTFKQQKLDLLDQEIQLMNNSRNCIVGASNQASLERCYRAMKVQKEELREEYDEHGKDFKKDSKSDVED